MGVVYWFEKPGTSAVDSKGVRTYTRKFLFEMSSLGDGPPVSWGSGGPSIHRYDSYPTDPAAVAVSLDCQPTGDQIGFYEVTITYTSKPFDSGNSAQDPTATDQGTTTPTSRPWVIKFGSVHGTRLLTKDAITGNPVANSAGQPFDPPPEIPTSNLQINITAYKDLATFDPISKILTYQDSINNAAVLLAVTPATTTQFAAKTLRCTEYNCTSHEENGAWYWQVDLTLEFKWAGWNPVELLDAGTCYIKSMSLPPQPILDATGNPVTSPVPLNGSGNPLNAGATLVYKSFSGYTQTNFATILS